MLVIKKEVTIKQLDIQAVGRSISKYNRYMQRHI